MQVALQLLLRLLPSIVLLILGFLVVKDERMASAWADVLQKTGSISRDQLDDPDIRKGIRLPFFILSGLFLLWPILYFFRDSYAQTPVQLAPLPSVSSKPAKKGAPTPTPLPTATPDPVTRPEAGGGAPAPSGGAGMTAPKLSPQGQGGSGGLAPANVN